MLLFVKEFFFGQIKNKNLFGKISTNGNLLLIATSTWLIVMKIVNSYLQKTEKWGKYLEDTKLGKIYDARPYAGKYCEKTLLCLLTH